MTKIPLLNRIRTSGRGGLRPPAWMEASQENRVQWRAHLDAMLEMFLRNSELPAFNLDQVARHYFVDNPKEVWSLADLRGLQAPHPACWMEYVFPGKIHSEIGDQDAREFGRVDTGWLILAPSADAVVAQGMPPEAKSVLVLQRFEYYQLRGDYVTGPDGLWVLGVDEAGCLLDRPCLNTWAPEEHIVNLEHLQAGLDIPLLACSDAEVAATKESVL